MSLPLRRSVQFRPTLRTRGHPHFVLVPLAMSVLLVPLLGPGARGAPLGGPAPTGSPPVASNAPSLGWASSSGLVGPLDRAFGTLGISSPVGDTDSSTNDTVTPADGPGGNCGGQATLVSDGVTWTCTFDSEFTGTSYDTQQWQVLTTNESGYFQGDACFENSSQNVSVGGGVLKLTVRRAALPTHCGAFASDWTAGELTSYELFDQTYGRIAIDAKFPSAKKSGLQSSLWLFPETLGQDSEGGTTAEIDLAEWYSEYPDLAIPYIHYDPSSANNGSSGVNAVTNDHCVIDQNTFNEYVLEWTPTSITMIFNGTTCLEDTWEPAAPETAPEPFNQPFFISLTQTLGVGTNQFDPATTPLPATTEVKYVRVWQGDFSS